MAKRIPSSPFRIDQEEDKPWVEDEEDNRVKDVSSLRKENLLWSGSCIGNARLLSKKS